MGDSTSIRDTTWKTIYGVHVRDTTWKEVNRAWVRESPNWKLFFSNDEPPTMTCIDQNICQAGGNPNCATLSGCVFTGEQHRIVWSFTGATEGYHAALHVSVGGGGYVETADALDLDQADPDVGCCDFAKTNDCDPEDGIHILTKNKSSDLGSCTTTFQYRARAEIDGTDTLVGTAVTHGSAGTGCDTTCIA
jgi:hypothetical protein